MIVDTSVLLAYVDDNEPRHDECLRVIEGTDEQLVVSPYVLGELDYLVATRQGVRAELTVLAELTGGAWTLATFDTDGLRRARDVIARYADQNIGLGDASLVVLADRYRTRTIATLDRRHFDVVRPLTGGRFRVLP